MSARLRIVHNCPSAAALNVLIDHNLVGANVVFRQSTDYQEFAPGSHDLVVTHVGMREPLLGPLSLMLTDHESYTLVVDRPKDAQAKLSVELRRDAWVRPAM